MVGVEVFIAIVVKLCQPAVFDVAGDGMQEWGDVFEFIGFAEVDAF